MSLLRVVFRLLGIAVVCTTMFVFLHVTNLVAMALERLSGSFGLAGRWRTRVFRRWTSMVAALVGMRSEVHGTPPKPPFFLVSNHLSYADVLLLGSKLRTVFVAKAEVERWPVVGSLCRSVDTLFIDRGSKRDIPRVMGQIEGILKSRRGVVIFPEGTSTSGNGVQRFKPSLLEAAARSGLPVCYATVSYRAPAGAAPAHLSVCWWGDMVFWRHFIELLKLPRFEACLKFGEEPIQETNRKVLAERLREAVERQFQPVA